MTNVDHRTKQTPLPLLVGLIVAVVVAAALVSSRLFVGGDGPPTRLLFLVPTGSGDCAIETADELELTEDEIVVTLEADRSFFDEPVDDELALVVLGPDDIDVEAAADVIMGPVVTRLVFTGAEIGPDSVKPFVEAALFGINRLRC